MWLLVVDQPQARSPVGLFVGPLGASLIIPGSFCDPIEGLLGKLPLLATGVAWALASWFSLNGLSGRLKSRHSGKWSLWSSVKGPHSNPPLSMLCPHSGTAEDGLLPTV